MHASNRARFEEAYKRIARELSIPGYEDPNVDTFQLVSRFLDDDANGSWLLVLDNADDSDTFFRPSSNPQNSQQHTVPLFNCLQKSSKGSMIITTRDMRVGEKLANMMTPIPVLPLDIVEAQRLLKSKSHLNDGEEDDTDALKLLETLNYLPLAITQAAAFISENSITVAVYVQMLQESDAGIKDVLEEDFHDAGRDTDIQNSVFKTWMLSFARISEQKPRAAEILSLMAFLDRQAIPTELLRKDNERNLDFVTAIGTLKAFSLITEEKSQSVFGIHRLVQLSIQRWLENQQTIMSWQEKAMGAVAKCLLGGNYDEWSSRRKFSAHVQIVLGYNLKGCLLQRAEILTAFGSYDEAQDRYKDAEEKITDALAIN